MANQVIRTASMAMAAVFLLAAATASGVEIPYRVSGIIANVNGESRAIIEMPYGKSGTFVAGDEIDGATILAVAADGVTLSYNSENYFLRLKGDATLIATREPDPNAQSPVTSSQLKLDFTRTLAALKAASAKRGSKTLQTDINKILMLGSGDRIVNVNHESVTTPAASLDALQPKLEDGSLYKLVVANPDGKHMIYLDRLDAPADPGS